MNNICRRVAQIHELHLKAAPHEHVMTAAAAGGAAAHTHIKTDVWRKTSALQIRHIKSKNTWATEEEEEEEDD